MPDPHSKVEVSLTRDSADALLVCAKKGHRRRWSSTGCPSCEAIDALRAALQSPGVEEGDEGASFSCEGDTKPAENRPDCQPTEPQRDELVAAINEVIWEGDHDWAVEEQLTLERAAARIDELQGKLTMIALALKNHGIEGEVERGVERLIEQDYANRKRADRLEGALREIASYNTADLRNWEEENAADCVETARAALSPEEERV